MRLHEFFPLCEIEDESEHWHALDQTGFYGRAGAGCVFLAISSGRFMIAHRSHHVEQPDTWGTWGGAINANENPEAAMRREVVEEAGYHGTLQLKPLYVFRKDTFRYHNYLAMVNTEFKPQLNWETQGFRWCDWGKWPHPLHFGLTALLQDPHSAKTMRQLAKQFSATVTSPNSTVATDPNSTGPDTEPIKS